MYYQNVSVGQLIKRVSRFTVEIDLNGTVEPVHMNNTGRNKEIFIPGSLASVRYVDNPNRKTHYDLLAVQRQGRWINIDSLAPNHVAKECLEAGTLKLPGLALPYAVHPESTWRDSRLDFAGKAADGQSWFVETKGVTLANGTLAAFPDAPTTRAVKHVHTLTMAQAEGYQAFLLFIVQLPDIRQMTIYRDRFPELVTAITTAKQNGVRVLAYDTMTGPDQITLGNEIPFDEHLPFSEINLNSL